MEYTTASAEKSTVKISMTFNAEEWTTANDRAYRENKHKYGVNGFRKGKVPKHVLELYYGKGLFYEEALNILFAEHYGSILEKESEKFTVVGDPSLSVDDLTDEKVVLVATVPVKPDVQISSYTGIKINQYEYTVTDADVDKDIDATRERIAEKVEVTDRPAQMKDVVNIDFVGKVDGKEFEGGSAKGYDLTLGSHQFIAGFEEQVVGMKPGETKDLNLSFPDDYQVEDLKSKPCVFTVTLNKITGSVLPALDDEFAKKMQCDTLEAYRAKVRERLEKNAENRSRNETENSILAEIAKNATAEIPDAMIDRQEDASMQRFEYSLMYQGIGIDDYLAYIGSTKEEYKKNFEEEARRTVLNQLIIEKLIALEKIEASEEEIGKKIAEQAASVGKEPEVYRKDMDPRQLDYIVSDIKVTKLFELLKAKNEMVIVKAGEERPVAEAPKKKTTAKKAAAPKEEVAEGEEKPKAKKTTSKTKKGDNE